MTFKNKLSTKQVSSIFYLIGGLIIAYFSFNDINKIQGVLQIIGFLMIILSTINFLEETLRKKKIIHTQNSKKYDSHGEEKIANYFERKDIRFHLHPKIRLTKSLWIFKIPFTRIEIEPDFFLPEYNAYVEYWGMIDNEDYKKKSFDFKKKLYEDNDIDFISLYPKNLDNLDWVFTQKLLDLIKRREGLDRNWR